MPQSRTCLAMLVSSALLAGPPVSAQLASRPAAEWIKMLDAPERIAGLQVDEIVRLVAPKPGEVIADLGAGTGVFSLPFARVVGSKGKVYAVEIEPGLVEYIRDKAAREQAGNVHAVLGQFGDPALPAADIDIAFFHDALHHVADRAGYLAQLVKYLKPSARIAIVEMDTVKGPHRNDPSLQITKAQLDDVMTRLNFRRDQQADLSEVKWFASYSRRP